MDLLLRRGWVGKLVSSQGEALGHPAMREHARGSKE